MIRFCCSNKKFPAVQWVGQKLFTTHTSPLMFSREVCCSLSPRNWDNGGFDFGIWLCSRTGYIVLLTFLPGSDTIIMHRFYWVRAGCMVFPWDG